MGKLWNIKKGERVTGPFTSRQLKRLAQSGQITTNDQVNLDGTTNWKAASSIAGLFAASPAASSSIDTNARTVDVTDPWDDFPQTSLAQNVQQPPIAMTECELRQALKHAKTHERVPTWRDLDHREIRRIFFDEIHSIPSKNSKGFIDGCAMGCLLFPFIIVADFYIALPGTIILIILHKAALLLNENSYLYRPLDAFMAWATKNKINHVRSEIRAKSRKNSSAIRDSGLQYIDQLVVLAPLIASADKNIVLAEHEFKANAYGPFWDAISEAVSCLTTFNSIVSLCASHNNQYMNKLQELSTANILHSFPLTLNMTDIHVPDPRITLERLSACVRRGQTDFKFATIYEQKKSQKIALTVSSNLETAIRSLDGNIALSLANIASIMASRY